jgi:hypothetical protein
VSDAAAAFGLPTNQPTDDPLDALLAELGQLARLYRRLLECHRQTPGGPECTIDQVLSAASYADALLQTIGLDLPLARCQLPEAVHAHAMAAFFGGDCGIADRHSQPAVDYLDVTGHYATSAYHAGTLELLRANALQQREEEPEQIEQLLEQLTAQHLLDNPTLWRRLATTVCTFEASGQVVPHRVPRIGGGMQIKIGPLASREPVVRMLADLAAARLAGSETPRVLSAFSVTPVARRRKRLRPYTFPSGHRYDPATEDIFIALVEERLRTEHDTTLPERERNRRRRLLKLVVNAACFGLLCQINVTPVASDTELVDVDGSTQTVHPDALEEPGRWSMPLAASGLTATGRLLLRLARTLTEQTGHPVVLWDTDSLAATGLTDQQVAVIQHQFERLSPYDQALKTDPQTPLLLALEPENFDPLTGERLELCVNATASKNYDLYTLSSSALTLVKWSEHGLGHLCNPTDSTSTDTDWIREGRQHLLARRLGLRTNEPHWWHAPSLSILRLNRPGELARLQAAHPNTQLRPFSRIIVAHPLPQYARDPDGRRRTPVAPYHEAFTCDTARWTDIATGEQLALRHQRNLGEAALIQRNGSVVLCETVGAALERNNTRPESKALDETGQQCSRQTVGPLTAQPTRTSRTELIGKETRNLERAGITEDPSYTRYTDSELQVWRKVTLPTLRKLAPQTFPRHRPSRRQCQLLTIEAQRLAREFLNASHFAGDLPSDTEELCRLYLDATDHKLCACGCGTEARGRSRYASAAHRTGAHRARRNRRA